MKSLKSSKLLVTDEVLIISWKHDTIRRQLKLTATNQMILKHVAPSSDNIDSSLSEWSDVDLEESAEDLIRLDGFDLGVKRLVAVDHFTEGFNSWWTWLRSAGVFVRNQVDFVWVCEFNRLCESNFLN